MDVPLLDLLPQPGEAIIGIRAALVRQQVAVFGEKDKQQAIKQVHGRLADILCVLIIHHFRAIRVC